VREGSNKPARRKERACGPAAGVYGELDDEKDDPKQNADNEGDGRT